MRLRHCLPTCLLLLSLSPAAAQAAGAPSARTDPPTSVTSTSALGNGAVGPNGRPTTYFFRYGRTLAYGQVSAVGGVPPVSGRVAVRQPLTGLAANTRYHFQLVAENASGTSFGADLTFKTKQTPNTIVLSAAPNPIVYGGGVILSGTLTGPGVSNRPVRVEQNPFPYLAGFQPVGPVKSTNALGQFSFAEAPGLNTQFRVVAQGGSSIATAIAPVDVRAFVRTLSRTRQSRRNPRHTVLVRGSILPAHPGSPVLLERLLGGGRFDVVAVSGLHGGAPGGRPSNFAVRSRIRRAGRYRIEVLIADGSNLPAVSKIFRLRRTR